MALSDGPILDAQAGRGDVRLGAHRRAGRGQQRERPGHARLPARVQPAQARLRRRDVRPGAALRARDPGPRRPAGPGPHRPADGRPAPDHGRAHLGPLAVRAVPALRRSSSATTARRGPAPGRRTPWRARPSRSSDGWRPTARSRRSRPWSSRCSGSSGPGWSIADRPAPRAAGAGAAGHVRRRWRPTGPGRGRRVNARRRCRPRRRDPRAGRLGRRQPGPGRGLRGLARRRPDRR